MCVAVLPWIAAAATVYSTYKATQPVASPAAPSPAAPAPSPSSPDVSQSSNDATRQLQMQKGIAATMTNGGTGVTSAAATLAPSLQAKKTVLGG